MESAPKPKILLLRQTSPPDTLASVERLEKALSSFCDVKVEDHQVPIAIDLLTSLSENYDHIFLELCRANEIPLPLADKVTLFSKNSFDWNNFEMQQIAIKRMQSTSCLVLGDISTPDLLRSIHLYMIPKKTAGLTTLMEKGSLILGEKIQDLDGLGTIIDKLYLHFSNQDAMISSRSYEMRQLVTAMVHEGYSRASEVSNTYPTVDFQCSANQEKIAFTIRFPMGNLRGKDLRKVILHAESVPWFLSWQCADFFCVIQHEEYQELEIFAVVYRGKKAESPGLKSLVIAKREKSAPAGNLLAVAKAYSFSTISALKIKNRNAEQVAVANLDSIQNELDEILLPEPIRAKMAQTERERIFLKDLVSKKEDLITELTDKLSAANKEIIQKRNELISLSREQSNAAEQLRLKALDLEKKLSYYSKENSHEKKDTENQANKELIQKHEQKYAALHKDFLGKEREIQDLKAALLKVQKSTAEVKQTTVVSNDKDQQKKLQDAEAKELVLRQEVKKLTFKLETMEKTSKATLNESSEKLKLIEKKYEEVKAREMELMKKLDAMTAQLKKANKAA